MCSGRRKGKQITYALLDKRVPHGKTLTHDEALAELARRYFTSYGPAAKILSTKAKVKVSINLFRQITDEEA